MNAFDYDVNIDDGSIVPERKLLTPEEKAHILEEMMTRLGLFDARPEADEPLIVETKPES